MKQPQPMSMESQGPSEYWMRAVSFAGLHRILKAVSDFPSGLKAGEINTLIQEGRIQITRRGVPSLTTLYHYRNTLLRLNVLKRDGRRLRANTEDPDVDELLRQPAPDNEEWSLRKNALEPFSRLIMRNEQCKSFFFDMFSPTGASFTSVADFRQNGVLVKWTHRRSSRSTEAVLQNQESGQMIRYTSSVGVISVLQGVRYWARDELKLIDEYCRQSDDSTVMFPLSRTYSSDNEYNNCIVEMARFILSLRTSSEWTLFSIFELIIRCCEARRKAITTLFHAIDLLIDEWPNHIILIPTSQGLATLTANSPQREKLELRRYYKKSNIPYISHIRIHEDVTIKHQEWVSQHEQYFSEIQA